MPDAATLISFSIAALVLFVIPGPAVLFIISQSVAGGRKAGLVSTAGIHVGSLVHIAAAVAGLSTLLVTSAYAFRVVRWAGAAYLLYLAYKAFTDRQPTEVSTDQERHRLGDVFRQGFIVNLLNPKTAVFFLAFVPQFVDPARGTTTQILVLGALFVLLGLISDGLYATIFGTVGQRLVRAPWWRTGRRVVPGAMYAGLGLYAVIGDR